MKNIFETLGLQAKPRPSVDEEIASKLVPMGFVGGVKPLQRLLRTSEILTHYGKPGDPDNLVTITVPFPFKIAWDLKTTTNRISCHKKIAPALLRVFTDLLAVYGPEKIKALGIDLFGGLNNFRPQRGCEQKYKNAIAAKNFSLAYTYLSRHAWAIAIDLDPARNQLKQTSKSAQFAKPEYKPMKDIFYKHGFIGYGPERNNDWMHWEIGVSL